MQRPTAPGAEPPVDPRGEPNMVLEGVSLGGEALDRLMPLHLSLTLEGRITRCGPTLVRLRPGDGLVGRLIWDVFQIRRPRSCKSVSDLLTADRGRVSLTFRDGIQSHFKAIAVPMPGGAGALLNLSFGISVVEAVRAYDLTAADFAGTDLAIEMLYLVEAKSAALSESKKLNLRLQGAKVAAEEQAYTDTLTGLKNRRAMEHVLKRLTGLGVPFGLMQLDLDYFKQVNDTHGHQAGDDVLQAVAQKLVSETRASDTIVRAGGDEFVLIFPDLVDIKKLTDLGQRIIARLEEPVVCNGAECRISGSIGLTTNVSGSGWTIENILEAADTALYASKHAGRGCVNVQSVVI